MADFFQKQKAERAKNLRYKKPVGDMKGEKMAESIEQKAERAKNLRYKKPVLERLYCEKIKDELSEIIWDSSELANFDDEDISAMLSFDGESDNEFRIMGADLWQRAERIYNQFEDGYLENVEEWFDTVMVALVGRSENCWGFDTNVGDYFDLGDYETNLAQENAKKKLMQLTKEKLISTVGECLDIALKYLDICQGYDYLHATLDIMMGDQKAVLKAIKDISDAYEAAANIDFAPLSSETRKFERLVDEIPAEAWVI